MRYETNETANDRWGRVDLAATLFSVGAKRVRMRNLYGLPNTPQVVTFFADSREHADQLCLEAYKALHKEGEPSLPSLFSRAYKPSK